MIDVMVQGGASGSPVFPLDRPEILGIVYGGLQDIGRTHGGDAYRVVTNYTYVVPARFIRDVLRGAEASFASKALGHVPRFDEVLASVEQDPAKYTSKEIQWERVEGETKA